MVVQELVKGGELYDTVIQRMAEAEKAAEQHGGTAVPYTEMQASKIVLQVTGLPRSCMPRSCTLCEQ